jgi:ABC-2 type transport system ATP-binding protein
VCIFASPIQQGCPKSHRRSFLDSADVPASALEVPAVEVVDLTVTYRARPAPVAAVQGLSMVAAAGRVTALLGPNGAGKTTTVEVCEGFPRPSTGTVRVLGRDPRADAKALRPRVGVMLQDGGVPGGARAMEVLRHAARLYAAPADVAVLAGRLGVDRLGRTPYRRLSGGEQQRVRLALALVGRPELVFLDEPTAGLDPQARRAVWELVGSLRDDGVAVVLTTHLMDEAEQLADDVVIVDAGRVVAAGTPADLTATDAAGTIRFRAQPGLRLAELVAALPAGTSAVEDPVGSYVVRTAGGGVDPALLATVTAWCAAHHVMPDGLAVERRTLEDVFLSLTGKELR